MSATRAQKSFTMADVLVSVLSPNESVLPDLLPVANQHVGGLLTDGITDEAVVEYVDKVALAGCRGHAKALAAFNAWEAASTGGADLHDPIDSVMCATRDAAFALGLALGLRVGGAR